MGYGRCKICVYWVYGKGKGKVWLDYMRYTGSEASLWNSVSFVYDEWDMRDAKVACQQLGFSKTVGYWVYGKGMGKVWLDRMRCTGSQRMGKCSLWVPQSPMGCCCGTTYIVYIKNNTIQGFCYWWTYLVTKWSTVCHEGIQQSHSNTQNNWVRNAVIALKICRIFFS